MFVHIFVYKKESLYVHMFLINSERTGPMSMKFFGRASGWPASDALRFGDNRKLKGKIFLLMSMKFFFTADMLCFN